MAEFHSIREATKVTGVSATTLKRFVRAIVTDADHPHRPGILPTVEDVKRMKIAGKQFAWTISDELLQREFGERASRAKPEREPDGADPFREVVSRMYDQLQLANEQLKVKDAQIASQMKIIDNLSERIHENNVLMATVQKQLALPEAQSPKATVAKVANSVKQSAPKRPARKGIFARLFR